jgi:sugar phosphate isomerase/epimerase
MMPQPMMTLAVSTYSLWRWRRENNKSLEHALEQIKSFGVQAVEFAPIGPEADDLLHRAPSIRKCCDRLGLRVCSVCVGAEMLVPPRQQKKVVDKLKGDVEVTQILGAPTMRHDVTRGEGANSFAATLKSVVPAIRQVADYAAAKYIKTSLENHGFYMQASKRVEQLIKAVDHENFGLTIDLGNFLCVNEDPTDATKRLAKYVIMAHAKDFHVKPKKQMPPTGWFATPTPICLRGAIAGHGVLDLPAQHKLLKKAGYNGCLSLEFEGMEEPIQAIALGLDYLRKVLADVSPSR